MRVLMLLGAVALTGCATSKTTYLPDGSTGHVIDCSGTALNWGYCEKKAGDLCKQQGYSIVSRSGDQGAVASAGVFGGFAGSVISRSMTVKCGKAE